ncbi:MAG TPA: glycosyltransferase, partial [Mucilaginibacter sp.]|nr:glycosyltransferase [Mucilaginibacter sp.]
MTTTGNKTDINRPKVSIVTVVFNAADSLELTILSVINQSYPNTEFIIIDGGSTDGTVDLIKKYDKKINYWISEKDSGIYDAMNKALDVVSGDWVYFLGAGD